MAMHTPFWKRTPPAVFAPIFGLFGLGLAWRAGLALTGLPGAPAEMLLGAVTLLWLAAALCYGAKAAARPGVVAEDLRVVPGRAGLAAMSLGGALLASVAVPYDARLAGALMWLALGGHAALAVLMIRVLLAGPPEQRQVTPAWHLSFVGFIVSAFCAAQLGQARLALGVLVLTAGLAAVIYAVSLRQLMRHDPPPPLRPLLAIHLAPVSLFGSVLVLLDHPGLAQVFGGAAMAVLGVLLWRARYLTAAGFSPLWGAFTFPLAAFAGLCLQLGFRTGNDLWSVAGLVTLAAASALIPWIAARVLGMWIKGTLAAKTGAAIA
ncbi:TDT family transporter [Anianabacter salinae]|uniref:SLAC1 family transporter n=1 Tax=Anianabacter salinae TaxID=2851023 RepID=UPI00225DFDAF|nr:tellurium resistance protein [Anianabacter salinae]